MMLPGPTEQASRPQQAAERKNIVREPAAPTRRRFGARCRLGDCANRPSCALAASEFDATGAVVGNENPIFRPKGLERHVPIWQDHRNLIAQESDDVSALHQGFVAQWRKSL